MVQAESDHHMSCTVTIPAVDTLKDDGSTSVEVRLVWVTVIRNKSNMVRPHALPAVLPGDVQPYQTIYIPRFSEVSTGHGIDKESYHV